MNIYIEKIIELLTKSKLRETNKFIASAIYIYRQYGDPTPLINIMSGAPELIEFANRNIALIKDLSSQCQFKPIIEHEQLHDRPKHGAKIGFLNANGDILYIPWNDFTRVVLVYGLPGRGKTTVKKHIATQALNIEERDFNIIVFDQSEKREYRDLTNISDKIIILPKDKLWLNPFQAKDPNDIPRAINTFLNSFFRSGMWGPISESMFEEVLYSLYEEFGCFNGSNAWPTFKDLYNKTSDLKAQYKGFNIQEIIDKALLRIKENIREQVFNCRVGLTADFFSSNDLVIELHGFSDDQKSFVTTFIADSIFQKFADAGYLDEKLHCLCFFEESRALQSAHRDTGDWGEPRIVTISTLGRATGFAPIFSTQEMGSIHPTIDSIANTRMMLPLGSGTDIEAAGKSLRLSKEEMDYIPVMKPYGEAIVKTIGHEPCLVRIPKLDIGPYPSKEEFEARMRSKWEMVEKLVVPIDQEKSAIVNNTKLEGILPNTLLHIISRLPFNTVSQLKELKILTDKDFDIASGVLEKEGFAEKRKYPTSKTNQPTYFVLLPKAIEYLGKQVLPGHGGYEHSLYCSIIASNAASRGHKVKFEGMLPSSDKAIDVLVTTKDGLNIAYEVTISYNSLIHNVIADFSAGADQVVIVTAKADGRDKAVTLISETPELQPFLKKISFRLIWEIPGME